MLKSIYKGGSGVILSRPQDEDYFYYYDNEQERREAVINNKERDKDIHFRLVENAKNVFLGCYTYPFMEHVKGDNLGLKDFSIFDVKDEYLKLLKKYAHRLDRTRKEWYHLYIAITMFEKGKMSLTKKEKATAQEIHDKGINCDQYNHIIDYLEKNAL